MSTVNLFISGHKPERLCGSFGIKNKKRTKIRTYLYIALSNLKEHYEKQGDNLHVLTSLNLGVDSDVAALCILLKIPYSVYVVGMWQSSKWVKNDKLRFTDFLECAQKIWICDRKFNLPPKDLYSKRDEKIMLDCSGSIMVFDGEENGGTYHKIINLRGLNKPVEIITPEHAVSTIDSLSK